MCIITRICAKTEFNEFEMSSRLKWIIVATIKAVCAFSGSEAEVEKKKSNPIHWKVFQHFFYIPIDKPNNG